MDRRARYGVDGRDRISYAAEKLHGVVDIRVYDNTDDLISSPRPLDATWSQTYAADAGQSIEVIHGQVLRDAATRDDFWQFVLSR
jgi:hypothetical protein